MTEVSFYHLQKSRLEDVLPMLLEKTLGAGKRALVMTASGARAEHLGQTLWSYKKDSWLPHGGKKDGRSEDQPIWLTELEENPNDATFVFLTDGAERADLDGFERCFELFDGNDGAQVAAARERWKSYKSAGYQLKYLQQSEHGGWQEKASG
ncbi:MAG: DNA polymerase III subunit chi [Rhodospirillaceae bacterium]|jgi:DNA polymerase III subunit chi|nr:DNA polymerase III subunit chi [Rhodospirillaceae bacterium]MBT5244199.1 DNA polymerase III subunit chi [Rhodospirillaceae bacterium]MBT5561724.1 DNA polymerase III subunit chi [Rhodospirillaceae bacterium]MBT6243163.1 DNA polymerase III subunit chi [Rhodospirillaceae bacterium]MBT7137444.1 DNA polymerase III subunit chi [Rhodospirillaceae bacterium]